MLGLNAEPAVVCRGLTRAGLQSGSKETACLMFLTFFWLFARERQIARRITAKEIAGSRGARGTASGCEEKAKNLTADEPAVVPQPRHYGGQDFGELSRVAADIRRWLL